MHAPPERHFAPVLCLVGASSLSLWALTPAERLIRQFAREGVRALISPADAPGHMGAIIFVRADAVIDQPLIPVLIKRPNLLLVGESTDGPARVAIHARGEIATAVLAVLDELFTGKVGAADLIDFVDEAELDGVEEGNAVVAPTGGRRLRILGRRS